MRICSVVFDYRNLNRYGRLFDVFEKSARASNPRARFDLLRVPPPAWDGSQKASYFSNNYKLKLWVDYLDTTGDEPVIFMDCDLIVRKPLDSAFDGKFDIGLVTVGRTYAPYNGGVVFVSGTPASKEFMKLWQKVDQEIFENEDEHWKWGAVYKGQNQAALGKILETMDHGAKIKHFPSWEWNAVDPDWGTVNPHVCRVVHVKSALRKICLGENKNCPRQWKWILDEFNQWEGPFHNPAEIATHFKAKTGYAPNIDEPQTLMEKITAKKIGNRDPYLTMTADKLNVREYVESKGLGEYIVPMLYVSPFPVSLPWKDLPEQFFIKMNNASGRNMAIEAKSRIARGFVEQKINEWIRKPYGVDKGEWAYKNINPNVIVEPLLPGDPMPAIKFHCFHGEAKIGQVIKYRRADKKISELTTAYLDPWEPLPMSWDGHPIGNAPRPEELPLLIELSEKLAQDFEYCRVDWLKDGNGRIWFSEITHYPTGGRAKITPKKYDEDFGKFWHWNTGEVVDDGV